MTQDSTLNKGTKIGLKHEEKIIKPEEIHHILEPGELGVVLELIVSDPKTGKVTEHRVMKSRSFVRQFLELLYVRMAMSTTGSPVSIRDTANTLRNVYILYNIGYHLDVTGAATDVTLGIIIGTGNTAPTIDDYVIETIIPHATMNYGGVTFGLPAADATTSQLTITRNFSNVSGAPLTVNEIGLYCRAFDGVTRYFMIIRDVIVGGIVVPDGQTLTANYRPQVVI